ncbi:hypothetical protein ACEPAF_6034 [Sanghuangporus sanghuang]
MLVVHPASTCDVCLESYDARPQNIPYSISCGHVFCLGCLKSLRQHICPLCRSPFEASELRRLHVDRADSQLLDGRRTPSPSRTGEKHLELPADNALGLVDDIPRATQFERKISDLVLRSSFTNGVRERGIRELIREIHAFLSTEPRDMHTDLRSSFLLLYRFTELQTRYQQLEASTFDLRSENNRNKQVITDWERRYQDLQRSRARDQESARVVEASLKERLRIEELEWQRLTLNYQYDFVSEECTRLRDEMDKIHFSSPNKPQAPRRSTSAAQLFYTKAPDGYTSQKPAGSSKSIDDVDVFSHLDPGLFRLSPVPPTITLADSRQSLYSDEETPIEEHRRRAPESPSRTSSTSSNISRASDSAAALKPYVGVSPMKAVVNRQRSDSYPNRDTEKAKIYRFEGRSEVSTSAPSSYMYRPASPTRALFPTTPPVPVADVQDATSREDIAPVTRLYSLLEKSVPSPESGSPANQHSSRPALPRSASYQQPRSSDYSDTYFIPASSNSSQNISLRRTQQRIQVQTGVTPYSQYQKNVAPSPQAPVQNQIYAQASEAISPIQRTPPRPVLPRTHSYFTLYSPPPAKPVSPKENHVGVRGTLPRRGSLSSASAAALTASSGTPPAVVPPSSLGLRRSHGQGLFGGQDSDA